MNWITEPLGNICDTSSGGTPNRKDSSNYLDGEIPWVKSGELKNCTIFTAEETITKKGLDNSSAKIFPAGTLLIALYGANIGKLAFLGIEAATNQAVCGLFHNSKVRLDYLYYYLFSQRDNLVRQGIGGAQPNISQTILKKLMIPHPISLESQQEIVNRIEELFSELDKGIETLLTIKQQLEVYRQAVLSSVFCDEGNLHRLSEFFDVTGGITKNSKRENLPIKMPYLRVANVYYNRLDLTEIKEIGVIDSEIERCALKKNDLLIVEGNGSKNEIGRIALWDGQIENCLHQNHIIKGRPLGQMLPIYALYYLISKEGRNQITDVAKSTSGLYTLSTNKIKNLMVPYCDITICKY